MLVAPPSSAAAVGAPLTLSEPGNGVEKTYASGVAETLNALGFTPSALARRRVPNPLRARRAGERQIQSGGLPYSARAADDAVNGSEALKPKTKL